MAQEQLNCQRSLFQTPSCVCEFCGRPFSKEANKMRHIKNSCKNAKGEKASPLEVQNAEFKKRLQTAKVENTALKRKLDYESKLQRSRSAKKARVDNYANSPVKYWKTVGYRTMQQTKKFGDLSRRRKMERARKLKEIARQMASGGGCFGNTAKLVWYALQLTVGSRFLKTIVAKNQHVISGVRHATVKTGQFFLKSHTNFHRAANVMFHDHGKMSSRQYGTVTSSIEKAPGDLPVIPLPKCSELMSFLRKEVKIKEQLHTAIELLGRDCNNLYKHQRGVYRDLEPTATSAAEKLLKAAFRKENPLKLDWCSHEYVFTLAIGGDGFPYLKRGCTVITLGILELGSRVHSPENLHLLFGGDFSEEHEVCLSYCRKLATQVTDLVAKQFKFEMDGKFIEYSFQIGALVGDQKWLAIVLGEFSCSAYYFSPFANLSKLSLHKIGISVGPPNGEYTEWDRQLRQKNAIDMQNKVEQHIKKHGRMPGNMSEWAKAAGHRQKMAPPIGRELAENSYICILHVGINAWRNWLADLVEHVVKPLIAMMLPLFDLVLREKQNNSTTLKYQSCLKNEKVTENSPTPIGN